MKKNISLPGRHREAEIMDDPSLDAARHQHALLGLTRINHLSRSAAMLWRPIRAFARRRGQQQLRLLDVATGAGDVPVQLCRLARRAGLALHVDACDRSAGAVEFARAQVKRAGADIHVFELDALSEELPSGYDVVTASLFLHHLDEGEAVELLQKMKRASGGLVLVNDLLRSRLGSALAFVCPRLLTNSNVVHVDAVRSVRAAFTREEARDLADRAGLQGAEVALRWPMRFLMTWSRE